jgi:hypothetical protein
LQRSEGHRIVKFCFSSSLGIRLSVGNMDIAEFVSKRSKKSPVWLHFGFPVINGVKDEKKTICKLCKATMPYSGNTTTMASHLDRHHWSVVHPTLPAGPPASGSK